MNKFAIISPVSGIAQNHPKVLLSEAYSPDSEWINLRYGRVERLKGRLPELLDAGNPSSTDDRISKPIQTPKLIYAITALNQGTKTITVTAIKATFDAAMVNSKIRINGSTGNDEIYTIASTTQSAGDLLVVVAETLPDATVDGDVFVGYNPVIKYHLYRNADTGTEYLLLATQGHIFLWTYAAGTLTVKFTCSASCQRWDIETYFDKVYATNNVDKIQVWDTSTIGNNFASLDTASGIEVSTGVYLTKAKYLTIYQNYIILGYVTIGGTVYPQKIVWNRQGYGDRWNINDVNHIGCGSGDIEGKDFLAGFGRYDQYLIIAKTDSMKYMYVTPGGEFPFVVAEYSLEVGLLGDTFINDKHGNLYWLASDFTIRKWGSPESISSQIDLTVRAIDNSLAQYAQSTFIPEYNQVWFAIPSGSELTGNNKVIAYSCEEKKWMIHPFAVRAFGSYRRQEAWTYDTLPFDTYDEWGWDLYDNVENTVGWAFDLASDYYGYTFDLHSAEKDSQGDAVDYASTTASDYTGKLVLGTNFSNKLLDVFKRISQLRFVFNKYEGGLVSIYQQEDESADRTLVGTIFLSGTGDVVRPYLPFDFRTKHIELTIESILPFEFLGVIFDYVEDGSW